MDTSEVCHCPPLVTQKGISEKVSKALAQLQGKSCALELGVEGLVCL